MDKLYLRVITNACDAECYNRIKEDFVTVISNLGITKYNFGDLKSYWKIDGYGEMDIDFIFDCKHIEKVKSILSDCWDTDVTDSRWATIFCEYIVFMWLTN